MIAAVLLGAIVIGALIAAVFGVQLDVPIVPIAAACAVFALFFVSGVHIAAALGIFGLLLGLAFSDRHFWLFAGEVFWGTSSNFIFVAVPLFLLMGEILLRAGISEQLFRGMSAMFRRVPGQLLHTNIFSSAVFSAVSGSSVATAATIGSVALPYFAKTKYDERMVLGTLGAGGAIGNLIPPGITFIVYGMLTETSVSALYKAAILPSVLVVALFTVVILIHAWRRRRKGESVDDASQSTTLMATLIDLGPTSLLIVVVLGSIYGGYATPTEAAALGVVGAVLLAIFGGKLTTRLIIDAGKATARNTALIAVVMFGAFFLNYILSSLQVPQQIAHVIDTLPLPPWGVMVSLILFFIAIGTFMEGFSIVIVTVPIVFPVVVSLGYDPIWFGVIVVMITEIALISPPDGTVMYVLQGMRPKGGSITDVYAGVMPFFVVYVVAVFILLIFPEIVLWLPRVMRG